MIDPKELFAVTYKANQASFNIYQRKYMHEIRLQSIDLNLEGSKAIEIASKNLILVTNVDELIWIECKTY